MKLNAVGVASKNLATTASFYTLLGFEFDDFTEKDKHIEPKPPSGSARLMIDAWDLAREIIGEEPRPGNLSTFALEYGSPQEVDEVAERIESSGFTVVKSPWDAVWGQRYAIVQDPDGYRVDLYAAQKNAIA